MNTIKPKKAEELIKNGNAVSVDVRTRSEFDTGHIPTAINIDFYQSSFEKEISKLDKNKYYIMNCQSGGRSGKACALMTELGFSQLSNLEGGIVAWKEEGIQVDM